MQQVSTATIGKSGLVGTGAVAVESVPPIRGYRRAANRGVWSTRLGLARAKQGVWFRSTTPMTKSSAAQMASDLRNSYRRRSESLRLTGTVAGERWETEYGNDSSDPNPSHFYVWFRLVVPAPSTRLAKGGW